MSRANRSDRRRKSVRNCRPLVEELENRLTPAVASTSFHVLAHPAATGSGPSGYTPLQILEAYGFYSTSGTNNISFNGAAGNGAGQTIAIVDAYNDPNIGGDLAAFDAQFNLAAPPSFSVVNQNGSTTSLPGVDSSGGWEMEEALDVEWAHAIAPGASIVLVEASSSTITNLNTAVTTASKMSGVSVVSMSWSGGESSSETSEDSIFTTPSGHQGVTFLAATGDSGTPSGYPAFSPNVVAVGGTSLYLNSDNSYQSETAWSNTTGAGGYGSSSYEAEPAYQESVQSTGKRTVPDVSFDADPDTGVAIYDSYDNSSGPWTQIGGTSLATPSWAGIIAVINQGRVATGGSTLNGPTQTLPALYSLSSSDFHDVTGTNNGPYKTGAAYSKETGLGTPVATNLIPDMVNYANASVPHLVITTAPPTSVTAGNSFGFSASVEIGTTVDTSFSGSVTVSLANNPGGSTLSGSPLTVSVVSGVATFSGLSLNKAGTGYTLTVSGTSLSSVATSSFNVVAGSATQLVVSTQPPTSVAQNGAFSVAFALEDANNNVLTTDGTDSVTVSIANNAGGGTLGGTTTATVKNGVATFTNLTVSQPGTGYTLHALSGSFTSAATNAFNVTSTPTHLALTVPPLSSETAGAPFSVTVAAEDSSGNIVSSFTGNVTVSLSANPGKSTLGGTLTVKAVGGQATFSNLTLSKPGTGYVLQFSTSGLTSATSSPFNVVVAAARLVITAQPPSSVTAGASFGFTVAVEDSLGNIATGYAGNVILSLATGPAGSVLNGTLNVPVTNGTAQVTGLSINLAATGYSLLVTGSGLTSATSSKFSVVAGTATALSVYVQPPTSVSAGKAFQVEIAARDAEGNVATSFTGKVTIALASNPGSATLGGTLTVSAVKGLANFTNLTLNQIGTGYTLQATSTPTLTTVVTNPFNVSAAASKLVITTEPPSTIAANAGFIVNVSVEDANGNVVTGYTGTVTIAIAGNPSGGTVTVSVVNGVASFDIMLTQPGTVSLVATSSGLTSATTTSITVTAATGFHYFGYNFVRR